MSENNDKIPHNNNDGERRPTSQEQRMLIRKKAMQQKAKRREHSLHCFNVSVLAGLMAVATVFMIFGERPTISTEENRNLAKCPEFTIEKYLNGSFTSEFAEFFNDTVPMRSSFKTFISNFRAHLGFSLDGNIIHGNPTRGDDVLLNTSSSQKTTPSIYIPPVTTPVISSPVSSVTSTVPDSSQSTQSSESSTETSSASASGSTDTDNHPPIVDQPDHDNGEMSDKVFVLDDGRGMLIYYGSQKGAEVYADSVNKYKEAVGPNVNVYSMVVPQSVSFYLPQKYSGLGSSEPKFISYINERLDGVNPIDVYTALSKHTDEEIYSRTDHHWQHLGAYYAAEEFAKVAQVPFAPLSSYKRIEMDGYIGTLYGWSGENPKIRDNPEKFVYFKPQNEYQTDYYSYNLEFQYTGALELTADNIPVSSWYLVHMCGDAYTVNINTDCKNGRRLLIVKDSYGDALPSLLTSSFEEIWVVDMRWHNTSLLKLINDEGITDVVFCMNTTSATGGNQYNLIDKM